MSNVWNMILKPDIWDRQNGFEISNLVLPPTILWLGEFLLWPDVLPTFPNYYFPNIHVLRICITHDVDKDTRTTTVSTSPITNKIKIIWNQVPLFVVPHFRPPKKNLYRSWIRSLPRVSVQVPWEVQGSDQRPEMEINGIIPQKVKLSCLRSPASKMRGVVYLLLKPFIFCSLKKKKVSWLLGCLIGSTKPQKKT